MRPQLATVAALAVLAAAVAATPAQALLIEGTGGPDEPVGTPSADRVYGLAGDDFLSGRRGPDNLNGGRHDDTLHLGLTDALPRFGEELYDFGYGGRGDDRIVVEPDGRADLIDCGAGADTVFSEGPLEPEDVLVSCDRVEPDGP